MTTYIKKLVQSLQRFSKHKYEIVIWDRERNDAIHSFVPAPVLPGDKVTFPDGVEYPVKSVRYVQFVEVE